MNREIKFRVWHPELKYMIYCDSVNLIWDNIAGGYRVVSNAFENVVFHCFQGDPPIMQYTGVIDKNKTEMYEGDIIDHKGFRGVIGFIAGMFVIDYPDQTDSGPIGFLQTLDMEVIGNIFENKELLK